MSFNWTMSTTRCSKLLRVAVYANTSTTAFHSSANHIAAAVTRTLKIYDHAPHDLIAETGIPSQLERLG